MEYTDVEQYVEQYIRNLSFFKEKKPYQAFTSVLKNHFFRDSYDVIPYSFKKYVEQQTISEDLYDNLIIGVGYPRKLVKNLRMSQKKIIIMSLMDYNRYKSTLRYINIIGNAFRENFNIYELYADRRLVEYERKDWVMLPRNIYKSVDVDESTLNYDEIYNDTPTYFISKKHLNILHDNKSITLPFKTNLILVEMNNIYEEDDMSKLISATTFYHFSNFYFSLYINDREYNLTLSNIYQLWYYILYKYYGSAHSSHITYPTLITYNVSSPTFPYNLDELSPFYIGNILEEYNNLELSRNTVMEFFNKYFKEPFEQTSTVINYSVEDYRQRVINSIGVELIQYAETYMDVSENLLFATIEILGSISDSLKSAIYTSADPLMAKYGEYILKMFAPMLINPESTATYQLLMYFKPYHTQLISRARYVMRDDSSFNNAFIDTYSQFVTHFYPTSAYVLSDDERFSYSIETGYFEFSHSNEIIVNKEAAYSFVIGDLIYARDIYSGEFPTDIAEQIVSVLPLPDGNYKFILENSWTGRVGVFPRAYKMVPPGIHTMIDLEGQGFFSFTNVGFANEVRTNLVGFLRFGVGDFIYAPVDDQRYAAQIIGKNSEEFVFILHSNYTGTAGVWDKAYIWRPS